MSEQVVVVGAGPVGLACAISARRRGLRTLVLDAGAIVNSIARYPIQMTFFTTPELLEIGGHPMVCAGAKATREEAMMYYRGVVRTEGIQVRTYTRLLRAVAEGGGVRLEVDGSGGVQELHTERLILATGYYDTPRMLGVEGEALPHVRHYFDEAHLSSGLDVAVIGGRNSAVEAALLLYRAGARVTLICRGTELGSSVKYWLRPDIQNRVSSGDISARFGAQVAYITKDAVFVTDANGGPHGIPARRVYALTGYLPDTTLLRSCGISVAPETGVPDHDPATLQTNVPGIYIAGSLSAGYRTSDIFIENGRFDGERIFGAPHQSG